MLQGGSEPSNTDPLATEPAAGEKWMTSPPTSEGTVELALSKISSAEKGWRMIPARKGKPAPSRCEVSPDARPDREFRGGQLSGLAETDDAGHILCT